MKQIIVCLNLFLHSIIHRRGKNHGPKTFKQIPNSLNLLIKLLLLISSHKLIFLSQRLNSTYILISSLRNKLILECYSGKIAIRKTIRILQNEVVVQYRPYKFLPSTKSVTLTINTNNKK